MKRYSLLALALIVSMSFFACSGDDGAEGVAGVNGKNGSPQPVKVLILALDSAGAEATALDFNAGSGLPPGSEIDLRAGVATPALPDLTPYDAVLVYTDNAPAAPDTVGNVLADYVDQGGKLVILQASMSGTFAITGRIMTAGYSPLTPDAAAGDSGIKTLNAATIAFPLHAILVGVDLVAYSRPGNAGYSVPIIDTDAEVIAEFNGALAAFAVNAAETIVAINDYPNSGRRDIHKVAGNAIIWLTSM